MPNRRTSLHIGVSKLDRGTYQRSVPPLPAADADASAMQQLAADAGLTTTLLAGAEASRAAVIAHLEAEAAAMTPGDLLVVTFSGHGATFADALPPDAPRRILGAVNRQVGDEPYDQGWCLADGVLIDDDLHLLLTRFRRGARLYVLSDSCFSGTVLRHDDVMADPAPWPRPDGEVLRGDAAPTAHDLPAVSATVLLSAAAADAAICYSSPTRGAFTQAVLDVWDGGRYRGDHPRFHAELQARCPPGQVPDLVRYGEVDRTFEASRPFTG